MPIETRMHILASSKDVIHSWAIPSAGIKNRLCSWVFIP
jgi:heme/copper-type cytochrome/quinol oxidase subunit 2